jgi:hypothetical protein
MRLDAEVDLHRTVPEPHTSAAGERWRFRKLRKAEELAIERPSLSFAA